MDRWFWCDSSLSSGESVCAVAKSIRLYDGDKRTGYEDGHLTLTNHRLLWRHENHSSSLGLPLSLVILIESEGGGFTSSPKLVLHLSNPPPGHPSGPVTSSHASYVRLSFKHGGCSSFQQSLQTMLEGRAWETSVTTHPQHFVKPPPGSKKIHTGILGIERAILAKQEETSQNISLAFEDLRNLMDVAKEMVTLSRNISNKIKEHSVSADETTQFRSYLLSLGIDDPVTRESYGSGMQYHHHLAHEVARALEEPVREAGGVMLLSEVYCRMNRARGLQLLSPEDVVEACNLMKHLKLSLTLHTFESGVQVVQITGLDQQKVVEDTAQMLHCFEEHGMSAADLARECGVPLLLARERLLQAERCLKAVRDESSEGLRFFPNLFLARS